MIKRNLVERQEGRRGRRFTRPMQPEGDAVARTDRLWRDLMRHMDECERVIAEQDERIRALERVVKEAGR